MNTRDALAIGSKSKPPVLYCGEYPQWRDRFMMFIEGMELHAEIKQSIEEGPQPIPMMIVPKQEHGTPTRTIPKTYALMTDEEKKRHDGDRAAKMYLLYNLPNDFYTSIDSKKSSAKGMWDQIEELMMGSRIRKQLRVTNCIKRYEGFKAKKGEKITETYERFYFLLTDLSKNNNRKSNTENNIKFLSNLQLEWRRFTSHISYSQDLETLPLHEVFEMLLQDEEECLS